MVKPENKELGSKDDAKERLHLVLMQDRANVSVDFLELMKQEIIDVIKKYIIVDEGSIDVRLTNKQNDDGTNGAPALYANIPILNIKNDMKAEKVKEFEGVDFEKKLEEVKEEEAKKEKVEETISEMIDGIEEKQEVEEEEKKEKKTKTKSKTKKKEKKSQVEHKIVENVFDEEEETDDDVTFDDLLKAAEEEDIKKVSKGK